MHLPFDGAFPLLGIHPEDTPPTIQKYTCMRLFMAALFVIAEYWKQSKYPHLGE